MAAQRDWYEKDFYKALGVAESATDKQITKAYRSLARDLHPDKNPGNDVAEEKFKEVSAAYDVLGDEDKRAEYDEVRRMGPSMMGGRHGGSDGFSFNVGDMGDVLGGMFGRGGRQRGGGGAGIQPRRGADVEASLTIDFADAAYYFTLIEKKAKTDSFKSKEGGHYDLLIFSARSCGRQKSFL